MAGPDLILHPGLAKCATTSLQRLFTTRDHALPRALGLVWLGKGFRPWNGYPPVTEIMYEPGRCLEEIAALAPAADAVHMLSSEALLDRPDMVAALGRRFRLARSVVTVRLPLLQALSNWCFSGWMTRPVSTVADRAALARRHDEIAGRIRRHGAVAGLRPRLCPIEPPGLERRFCEAVADRAPAEDLADLAGGRSHYNESPAPSVAAALHEALVARGLVPIEGPARAAAVRAGWGLPVPPEAAGTLPGPLGRLLSDGAFTAAQIARYAGLLERSGTPPEIVAEAVARLESRIADLAARPAPSPGQAAALRDHAERIVDRIAAG